MPKFSKKHIDSGAYVKPPKILLKSRNRKLYVKMALKSDVSVKNLLKSRKRKLYVKMALKSDVSVL
jgi:hypothetical protein